MKSVTITTIDNPYSPFTQFDDWLMFDLEKGYCTVERLARLCYISSALSDEENNAEIENAIDELIKIGFVVDKNGNRTEFKKVYYEEKDLD